MPGWDRGQVEGEEHLHSLEDKGVGNGGATQSPVM